MAETETTILVKRVQTEDGIGQIDYESLANLPVIDNVLKIDSANAIQNKTVTTAFNNVSTAVNNVSTKVDTVKNELVNGDTTVNNSNNLNGQPASYYAALNTQGVSTYTHSKSGTVHNFVGTGNNGKAKMTADVAAGDTFTVNGQSVSAYCGPESATDAMAGETYSGKWVTFVFDGAQLNFKGGGGLSNTKLAQATATVNDVLSPKTFFSGNATLKQGTIQSMGGSDFTLDANNTSHTFTTSGKYCTGNMNVITNVMNADSKTFTPSASTQTDTFTTSGKLCKGDMTVTVNPVPGLEAWKIISGQSIAGVSGTAYNAGSSSWQSFGWGDNKTFTFSGGPGYYAYNIVSTTNNDGHQSCWAVLYDGNTVIKEGSFNIWEVRYFSQYPKIQGRAGGGAGGNAHVIKLT